MNNKLSLISKTSRYLKNQGIKKTFFVALEKLFYFYKYNNGKRIESDFSFNKELNLINKIIYKPKISIIVPVYNTDIQFLKEMIESVLSQSYENFELCIHNGGSEDLEIENTILNYCNQDDRVLYKCSTEQLGISDNSNKALTMATGDYIALLDHDDILKKTALEECVKVINLYNPDVIYSDEDKTDEENRVYFTPHRKSDWAPNTFLSYNYICHFLVFKSTFVSEGLRFRKEFDGSQDFDLIFNLWKRTTNFLHIPKVLYHWRISNTSTSGDISQKSYALDAGKKAVETYLKEEIPEIFQASKIINGYMHGSYEIKFQLFSHNRKSLIIVSGCFNSKEDVEEYFEQLNLKELNNNKCIFLNLSSNKFEYSGECKVIWIKKHEYTTTVNFILRDNTYDGVFFLNYNVKIINKNWHNELIMSSLEPWVFIVAPKIMKNSLFINSYGIAITKSNIFDVHTGVYKEFSGYFSRNKIAQNFISASPHIVYIKREAFSEIGYLSEEILTVISLIDYSIEVYKYKKFTKLIPIEAGKSKNTKWKNSEVDIIFKKHEAILEKDRDKFYPII